MISIDDFKKVEIRAGKILSVETMEGSDKLLKLVVDFGPASAEGFSEAKEETRDIRQILSGIKKYFTDPQELVGVICAFVTNLEPREMMGLVSQGMIMAVSGDLVGEEAGQFFSLLKIAKNVPLGSIVK